MAQQMQTPTGAGANYGAQYGDRPSARAGHGWIVFAAVMFLFAGATHLLWGISALSKASYFRSEGLLFGELKMWGVFYVVGGALAILAGVMVLRRSAFGAMLGIGLAMLSGLLTLITIGAYPVWSVIALVVDGLIIYGLAVHGFADETT